MHKLKQLVKTDYVVLVACGILFVCLAIAIKIPVFVDIDSRLTVSLYNLGNNYRVTIFFLFITDYLIEIVILLVVLAAIVIRHRYVYRAIIFLTSLASTLVISELLKQLFMRQRPFVDLSGSPYLAPESPWGYSFPSQHATLAFLFAYFISHIFGLKRWQIVIVYLLAFLVALSRVYLGAHYLFDVLAGFALGNIFGVIDVWLYNRVIRLRSSKLRSFHL